MASCCRLFDLCQFLWLRKCEERSRVYVVGSICPGHLGWLRARLAHYASLVWVRGCCHAGTAAGGTGPCSRFHFPFVLDYYTYASTGSTSSMSRRWIPAGGCRVLHGHFFSENVASGGLFSCMCVLVSFNNASSRGVCSMALRRDTRRRCGCRVERADQGVQVRQRYWLQLQGHGVRGSCVEQRAVQLR